MRAKVLKFFSFRVKIIILFIIVVFFFFCLAFLLWFIAIQPALVEIGVTSQRDINEIYTVVNRVLFSGLSLMGVGTLVAFLIIQVVTRDLMTPIRQLNETAQFLGKGEFDKRVAIHTGDEFEKLGNTFNTMAGLIQAQIEDLRRTDHMKDEFIALVSHNLRTPVTAVKGYLELMSKDQTLSESHKDMLLKLSVNTKVLDRLVEEILSISTMGINGIRLNKQRISLNKMLDNVLREVEVQAKMKEVKFVFMPTQEITIQADLNRLQDVFVNIVDNAVKFSHRGGVVTINISPSTDHTIISVQDTGIGIPGQEMPYLFNQFHRAQDYLSADHEGVGLGLYFTKLIVEKHNGKIWVDSKEDIGTTVFVSLPLTQV